MAPSESRPAGVVVPNEEAVVFRCCQEEAELPEPAARGGSRC
jgi:hypothetical protein